MWSSCYVPPPPPFHPPETFLSPLCLSCTPICGVLWQETVCIFASAVFIFYLRRLLVLFFFLGRGFSRGSLVAFYSFLLLTAAFDPSPFCAFFAFLYPLLVHKSSHVTSFQLDPVLVPQPLKNKRGPPLQVESTPGFPSSPLELLLFLRGFLPQLYFCLAVGALCDL